MARSMQNIASPGKMPMATMAGRGPITGAAPQGSGIAAPAAPTAPGQDGQQLMQVIMQIAQQIELMTGQPATPEQIQMALSQVLPGAAGAPPPGADVSGGQAMPMVPPQLTMKR